MSKRLKRGEILVENTDWVNRKTCIFIREEDTDDGKKYAVVWLDKNGYPESIGRVNSYDVVRPTQDVEQMGNIDITI